MNSQKLIDARLYEEKEGNRIPDEERPLFHLSPRTGWMNDPNGFSQYNGEYHLFYQYYPYKTIWGPMHWGHAVSKDLLHWRYLPAALAPDAHADNGGCFSGSALTLEDGRHLLMYTGTVSVGDPRDGQFIQTQCLAAGDGLNYTKYEKNPVLDINDLPADASELDFRDPKFWKDTDGRYRCVAVNCPVKKEKNEDSDGRLLSFVSDNGFDWKYEGILLENNGRFGQMWECPDLFELDGKAVLLMSPMSMLDDGKYFSGSGTVCMIGRYDRENVKFIPEYDQPIDCGIDFYATQTLQSEDGRRIMTAWMQNWDTLTHADKNLGWFGQMILPRELSLRDGRLYQQPVREIEMVRNGKAVYSDLHVENRVSLENIKGRSIDMTLTVRPESEGSLCSFEIRFAEDEHNYTSLLYRPDEKKLRFDRTHSGTRRAANHYRKIRIDSDGNTLKLRIILDRFSSEVFINDGRQTMTNVIFTPQSADGISFIADGRAVVDIEKYDLVF